MTKSLEENYELFWHDKETKERINAGVAFYEKKYGEYRLKIDVLPSIRYYLKPIQTDKDKTRFEIEVALKKGQKFFGRRIIGYGQSSDSKKNEVWMNFGPFTRVLVLALSSKEEGGESGN